ncbi:MAG: HD-GYP domain-containing protein, partial [Campylobacterota bacterium]|nr:HD-GYP domain-containing protein [Campylobacterota bacterium]
IRTYDTDNSYRQWAKNHKFTSLISFPLKKDSVSEVYGVVVVFSSRKEGFEIEEISMLEELSGDIGFAVNSFRQNDEIEKLHNEKIRNYEETILAFIKMIEERDPYTAGHTARVAKYSKMIATKMGYAKDEVEKLYQAAILHDIGKISTPDSVLLKPSHLNKLEYQLIQQHVKAGYEMLKDVEFYHELIEIMRHHHEHYDGNGYPNGLKGDEIPELSAIMAVADAFDAMTSNRIYKKCKSVKSAIDELINLKGKQFNPKVVEVAVEIFKDIKIDSTINQNPKTIIENERLAYYYKDSLTNLYNEDYLTVLLNQKDFKQKYMHGYYITINEEETLHSIAEELLDKSNSIMPFRYKENSIIIFSDKQHDIDLFIKSIKNRPNIQLDKIDLKNNAINTISELLHSIHYN